jgi:hypothetical protein
MILDNENMTEKNVKVRVIAPYRVVDDDGEAYSDGDELTVPEHLADQWLRSRFVEKVAGEA